MDVLRDVLLPKFSERGGVRKTGAGWDVRCPVPAHEDTKASLSVGYGKEQPVVFNCHAGCEPQAIVAALGLEWNDLCKPREDSASRGEWTPHGEAVAVYRYTDEAGTVLFEVCRTLGKQFPLRVPDATRKSGYSWKLGGTRRVLYRLPQLIEGVQAGEIIYVCEGEKDVHALERVGAVATCNPGGAGKWRPEYAEFFQDATVRIVADADKPGQVHARQVAASLAGIAGAVEIVEAGHGKDAADHLAAGLGLPDFVITHTGTEVPGQDLAPDLHEFLAGVDAPYDWIIEGILERGDRLIWTGEEGLGKTMCGRQIAVAAAAGVHPFNGLTGKPQRVLWIDCENSPRQGRRHFRRLAETAVAKGHRVPDGGMRLLHRPEGIDLTRDEDVAWFLERITAHRPDLLYIGPLYRLHATDINDEVAARTVTAVLDLARVKADCALVIEGHSPHGSSGAIRPIRPIGSSLFLRWPEFGYGISPAIEASPCKEVVVRPWRGARDERHWPKFLSWGEQGDWPWIDPDVTKPRGYPYAVEDAS